jgi:hypothetical protein
VHGGTIQELQHAPLVTVRSPATSITPPPSPLPTFPPLSPPSGSRARFARGELWAYLLLHGNRPIRAPKRCPMQSSGDLAAHSAFGNFERVQHLSPEHFATTQTSSVTAETLVCLLEFRPFSPNSTATSRQNTVAPFVGKFYEHHQSTPGTSDGAVAEARLTTEGRCWTLPGETVPIVMGGFQRTNRSITGRKVSSSHMKRPYHRSPSSPMSEAV